MNRIAGNILLISLFCFSRSSILAQKTAIEEKDLLQVKHTKDFTITGNGNAAEWNNATWNVILQRSSETLQKQGWKITPQPGNGKIIQYETRFKILYSEKGIYCLFSCEDSSLSATLKGDYLNLYDEDVVEAFFWTDTTMPVYFEYELSPLNYELPILVLNNKGNAMGWKPWQYEGERKIIHAIQVDKTNTTGNRFVWTAEFFIPYALLQPMNNVPPQKGTQWHANFYRIDYDQRPVYSSWQLTRRNFHDFERFGTIEFD